MNVAGSSAQTSGAHAVSGANVSPSVDGFSASNRVFAPVAPGGRITLRTRRMAGRGTVFRYRLSEPARVGVVIERAVAGRRVGRTCRRPTRGNRSRRKCTRYVRSGVLESQKTAGRQTTKFRGRLSGRPLRLGRYRARITATDAQGARSVTRRLNLRVVRP